MFERQLLKSLAQSHQKTTLVLDDDNLVGNDGVALSINTGTEIEVKYTFDGLKDIPDGHALIFVPYV